MSFSSSFSLSWNRYGSGFYCASCDARGRERACWMHHAPPGSAARVGRGAHRASRQKIRRSGLADLPTSISRALWGRSARSRWRAHGDGTAANRPARKCVFERCAYAAPPILAQILCSSAPMRVRHPAGTAWICRCQCSWNAWIGTWKKWSKRSPDDAVPNEKESRSSEDHDVVRARHTASRASSYASFSLAGRNCWLREDRGATP